jgi:hypothetical protein
LADSVVQIIHKQTGESRPIAKDDSEEPYPPYHARVSAVGWSHASCLVQTRSLFAMGTKTGRLLLWEYDRGEMCGRSSVNGIGSAQLKAVIGVCGGSAVSGVHFSHWYSIGEGGEGVSVVFIYRIFI